MPNVSGLRGTQPWLTIDSRSTSLSQWIEACLAPCLTFGRVYNRLELVWQQRDPRSVGDYDCCNFKCWACCLFCPAWSCLMARQRTRIRKYYDIAGSFQDDCWYSCCRPCCVLIQEERELLSRAELAEQRLDGDGDGDGGLDDLFEKPYQPVVLRRSQTGPVRRTSQPVTGQPASQFMAACTPVAASASATRNPSTSADKTPVTDLASRAHSIICGAQLQLSQLERRMTPSVPTVPLHGSLQRPPSLPLSDRQSVRDREAAAPPTPVPALHPLDLDRSYPTGTGTVVPHLLSRDTHAAPDPDQDPATDPHALPHDLTVPGGRPWTPVEPHLLASDPSPASPPSARPHLLNRDFTTPYAPAPSPAPHDIRNDLLVPPPADATPHPLQRDSATAADPDAPASHLLQEDGTWLREK